MPIPWRSLYFLVSWHPFFCFWHKFAPLNVYFFPFIYCSFGHHPWQYFFFSYLALNARPLNQPEVLCLLSAFGFSKKNSPSKPSRKHFRKFHSEYAYLFKSVIRVYAHKKVVISQVDVRHRGSEEPENDVFLERPIKRGVAIEIFRWMSRADRTKMVVQSTRKGTNIGGSVF